MVFTCVLKMNHRLMASRVEVLLTGVAFPRAFSRFITFILNRFIIVLLKGG
jgi:hypothetical protein